MLKNIAVLLFVLLVVGLLLNKFMINPIPNKQVETTIVNSFSKKSLRSNNILSKCFNKQGFQRINMYYKYINNIVKINGLKPINNKSIVIGIDIPRNTAIIENNSYVGTCILGHNNVTAILVSIINSTLGARIVIHGFPLNSSFTLFIRPFLYGKPYRHSYMLKITDLRKLLQARKINIMWVIWRIGLHKLHKQIMFDHEKITINDIELLLEIPAFYIDINNTKIYLEGLEEVSWRIIGYPVFSSIPTLLNLTDKREVLEIYKEIIRYMIYYSSPLRAYTSDEPQTPNTIKLFYYEKDVSGNCLAYSTASIVLGVAGFNQLVGLAINHKLRHAYSILIYPSRIYGFVGKVKLPVDIDGDGLPDTGDILIDTGFYDIRLLEKIDELYVFSPRSIGIIVSTINELVLSGKTFVYPSYDLMGLSIYDHSWSWMKDVLVKKYYPAYLFPGNSSKQVIVSSDAINTWYKYIDPNYRWGLPSKCIGSPSINYIISTDYDIGPPVPPLTWLDLLKNIIIAIPSDLFYSPSWSVLENYINQSINVFVENENLIEEKIRSSYRFVIGSNDLYIEGLGYVTVSCNATVICQDTCYGNFQIVFKMRDNMLTNIHWDRLKIIVYAGKYRVFSQYFCKKMNDSVIVLLFSMRGFSLKEPIYIYIDDFNLLIKPFIKEV